MKENRSILSLLEPEELACLKEVGGENLIFSGKGNHWKNNYSAINGDGIVYRIRPDYQPPKPEPKIVKCEVVKCCKVLGFYKNVGGEDDEFFSLSEIVGLSYFSHFEKSNGNKIGIENIATEIRNGGKVFACFVEE
jgi:hypothetical protein